VARGPEPFAGDALSLVSRPSRGPRFQAGQRPQNARVRVIEPVRQQVSQGSSKGDRTRLFAGVMRTLAYPDQIEQRLAAFEDPLVIEPEQRLGKLALVPSRRVTDRDEPVA